MKPKISIIIADDHPIVRKGLRDVVADESDLVLLGEAGDGEAALALIETKQPQIAVLDIQMPKADGFAVLREVKRRQWPVEIIFLTFQNEPSLLYSALDFGAQGYLLKDSALLDIVQSLRTIASGKPFVSPVLTGLLLNRSKTQVSPGFSILSPSERRVLGRIAAGKATKEIADELGMQPRTVESHRAAICQKLGLTGANSLLRFVLERKSELHTL